MEDVTKFSMIHFSRFCRSANQFTELKATAKKIRLLQMNTESVFLFNMLIFLLYTYFMFS